MALDVAKMRVSQNLLRKIIQLSMLINFSFRFFIIIIQEAKKERDAIIQELKEEELRLKQENRYKDELKKKLKLKLEAKSGLMDQMKEVEEKRKRDQEEEKKYKEEVSNMRI